MSALMLVGVLLLARQRTAGLLPAAVSAVVVPVVLIANHHVLSVGWALTFGPGIVCGWLALGRFLPAMARFLRRSPESRPRFHRGFECEEGNRTPMAVNR